MYINLETPRARRADERTVPAGDKPLANARAVSSHLAGALKKATQPHPSPRQAGLLNLLAELCPPAGQAGVPHNLGRGRREDGAPDEGNFDRSIDSQRAAPHGVAASTSL